MRYAAVIFCLMMLKRRFVIHEIIHCKLLLLLLKFEVCFCHLIGEFLSAVALYVTYFIALHARHDIVPQFQG